MATRAVSQDFGRRFGLLDLMILVAATAVSIALERLDLRLRWSNFLDASFPLTLPIKASICVTTASLPLAVFTSAWILMRWRKPRPAARRLLRQSGTVACASATLVFLIEAVYTALGYWQHVSVLYGPADVFVEMTMEAPPRVGFGVLCAWFTLAVGRRWRADKGWLDRSGRALGVAWIVDGLLVFTTRIVI
jgi:hypothetical protein